MFLRQGFWFPTLTTARISLACLLRFFRADCWPFSHILDCLFVYHHRDIDTTVEGDDDSVDILGDLLDYSVGNGLVSMRIAEMDIKAKTAIDISVSDHSSLNVLILESCPSKKFTFSTPEYFQNLTTLELDSIDVMAIPRGLYELENLRNLVLIDSGIRYIDNEVGEWPNLETIDMTSSSLTYIGESFCSLPSLKSAIFSYTDLFFLPDCIDNLTTLENLEIAGSWLLDFPESFTALPNLKNWFVH